MNMTERDWEIVLAEHRESFHAMLDSPEEPVYETAMPKPPPAPQRPQTTKISNGDPVHKYIRVEKSTAKAKFFVTHEDMAEIHGFWCPKVAIIKTQGDEVTVAKWCKIKVIQFI